MVVVTVITSTLRNQDPKIIYAMEKQIINSDKYVKSKPLQERIGAFLVKHIMWIIILLMAISLWLFFLFNSKDISEWRFHFLDYSSLFSRESYRKPEEDDRLTEMRDKLREREHQKRKGRYDHIVSGRDLVKTNYGTQLMHNELALEKNEQVVNKDSASAKALTTLENTKVVSNQRQAKAKKTYPLPVPEKGSDTDSTASKKLEERFTYFNTYKREEQASMIRAYVYGDQELIEGNFIRLRIGEDIYMNGKKIALGSICKGQVRFQDQHILVNVHQVGSQPIHLELYDQDLSRGLWIQGTGQQDDREALNSSLYGYGSRSAAQLPYEILRDITRNISSRRSQKQQIPLIADGYQVFLKPIQDTL